MRQLLKNDLDTIIKMMVTQFGMTMFGVMLAVATRKNNLLLLASSIMAILLYMFILYVHTWGTGARDRIKIDGGRMKYNALKGLYMSLIANAFNILLAIFANIGFAAYSATQAVWAADMMNICNAIARALQGMYLGVIQLTLPNNCLALLLTPIPALIISFLAYYKGCHNSWSLGMDKPPKKRKAKKQQ